MPAWGKQAGGFLPAEIDALLDYIQLPEVKRVTTAALHAAIVPSRGDCQQRPFICSS